MPEQTTQEAGADARVDNEQALAAARVEAVQTERQRVSEIQSLSATATRYEIDDAVISEFIAKGVSVDQARKDLLDRLAQEGKQNLHGAEVEIRGDGGASVTRDGSEQRLTCMQMALLLRADGRFFLARRRDHNGSDLGEYLDGCGPEQQKQAVEMAGEYRNFKLIDMAKEALTFRGTNPRGMDVTRIAELALRGQSRGPEFFAGGAETTSDFPGILANVANKTLRQGYEAYPRTFQAFSRQVTAQDFKPINRVMLADAPVSSTRLKRPRSPCGPRHPS